MPQYLSFVKALQNSWNKPFCLLGYHPIAAMSHGASQHRPYATALRISEDSLQTYTEAHHIDSVLLVNNTSIRASMETIFNSDYSRKSELASTPRKTGRFRPAVNGTALGASLDNAHRGQPIRTPLAPGTRPHPDELKEGHGQAKGPAARAIGPLQDK